MVLGFRGDVDGGAYGWPRLYLPLLFFQDFTCENIFWNGPLLSMIIFLFCLSVCPDLSPSNTACLNCHQNCYACSFWRDKWNFLHWKWVEYSVQNKVLVLVGHKFYFDRWFVHLDVIMGGHCWKLARKLASDQLLFCTLEHIHWEVVTEESFLADSRTLCLKLHPSHHNSAML